MTFRLIALPILLSAAIVLPVAATETSQYIAIDSKLQVPGGMLEPGTYTLTIEKHLEDRMLVRIANGNKDSDHILLAVPNRELNAGTDAGKGIVLFNSSENKQAQILRGWLCPSCTQGLEFVYPTAVARAITLHTAQPSLAASGGDLKSTSIWKISARYLAKSHKVSGIKAVLLINSTKSARAPVIVAGLKQLPKTATNTYALALWGLVLLVSAAAFRVFSWKVVRQ
jgi:LPXTG-motif cell wall-anchored protein